MKGTLTHYTPSEMTRNPSQGYTLCGDWMVCALDAADRLAEINLAQAFLSVDETYAFSYNDWNGYTSVTYQSITDLQGTVYAFVDAAGNIVAQYGYDAYGNILSSSTSVPALASNRFTFQGREYSHATGLYSFRARWYDPVTGRWLSKDPIGLAGGLNLYAFCGNDPVNNLDPGGLSFLGAVGDMAGKIWNLPNTAVGLVWAGAGYATTIISYPVSGASYAVDFVTFGFTGTVNPLDFPKVSIGNNAIQFVNHPLMPAGAITLGNTVSYGSFVTPDTLLPEGTFGSHE